VGKDHFKEWRERKTDKNYRFRLSCSLALLQILTGWCVGHTWIYKFAEIVKTMQNAASKNVIPAEAGIQVLRSARKLGFPPARE
jgi:hypothetical protein